MTDSLLKMNAVPALQCYFIVSINLRKECKSSEKESEGESLRQIKSDEERYTGIGKEKETEKV